MRRTTTVLVLLAGAAMLGAGVGCESSETARADDQRLQEFDPIAGFKPGLRAELLEMRKMDQALRGRISLTPASERRELFINILENNDQNVERLEEIIDQYGWPTISMVGKDGAEAAWLIAQHADRKPEFRERCLGLMQQAAAEGEASKAHLAYLVDRVMVEVSQQQFYGTQFWDGPDGYGPVPIIDPAGLDARREAAGLVSFSDYRLAMEARRPGAALAESDEAVDAPMNDAATASADPDQ
jgi:hypothetical protein